MCDVGFFFFFLALTVWREVGFLSPTSISRLFDIGGVTHSDA